jgi:type IV pilus assembly protein PilW
MFVTASCSITPPKIVLVTNCQSGELMTVTNVSPGANENQRTITHTTGQQGTDGDGAVNNVDKTIQRQYGADARLLLPYQRTYFIANSPAGSPSLFVSVDGGTPQELVPGIEDMQILYGRDTDADDVVDTWVASGTDIEMAEAQSVKVQLVVASDISVGAKDLKIPDLDNVDTTYTDGKLRKIYLTSAKVRNRGDM